MKMKKIIIFSFIIKLITFGIFLLVYSIFPNTTVEQYNSVAYIAHLNGMPLSLDKYKLYLRSQVHYFENTGGSIIWDTNMYGMTSREVVKRHALDSFILVFLTNQLTSHPYIEGLTQEELDEAEEQAFIIWNGMTPREQDIFNIEVIRSVVEDTVLHSNIREYITQNYVEHQREQIFLSMFSEWREESDIVINFETWDAIDINDFRPEL